MIISIKEYATMSSLPLPLLQSVLSSLLISSIQTNHQQWESGSTDIPHIFDKTYKDLPA